MTHTAVFPVDVTTLGLPSIGVNVPNFVDYTQPRFIDHAKALRPWWENNDNNTEIDSQYLDADGNVHTLPPSTDYYQSIFWADMGASDRAFMGGAFTVTWEGDAADVGISSTNSAITGIVKDIPNKTITFNWDSTIASFVAYLTVTPAQIEAIPDTNPRVITDPPRNFKIIKDAYQTDYDGGEIHLPNMADALNDLHCIRFMDWSHANLSPSTTWASRRPQTHQRWAKEVPWEVCINLANRNGVNPWLNIPHQATDDYVTQFATLVRNTLNAGLVPRFEWSNECWNPQFSDSGSDSGQFSYCYQQANADWGSNDGNKWLQWQSKRSTECMQLIATVFGSRPFRAAIGTQTANIGITTPLLDPTFWASQEPGTYVDPKTVHHELAITTYYGHNLMTDNDAALAADYTANGKASVEAMIVSLADTEATATIADMQAQGAAASAAGLGMVAYEANNHMTWNAGGALETAGYTKDEYIADVIHGSALDVVTERTRDAFRAAGGTVMAVFIDMGGGNFGPRRDPYHVSPNWTGWTDWQSANPKWWLGG